MLRYFTIQMAIIIALCLPVILILRYAFHRIAGRRLKELNWCHEAGVVLLFAFIAAIASQTLWSRYFGSGYNWLLINLNPLKKTTEITDSLQMGIFSYIVTEVIGNIVLFLPVGFLLPLLWRTQEKFWVLLLCCVSASLFIELFQLFIPNRATDIDDVIMNTMGALLGFVLYLLIKRLSKNKTDKFKIPKKNPAV